MFYVSEENSKHTSFSRLNVSTGLVYSLLAQTDRRVLHALVGERVPQALADVTAERGEEAVVGESLRGGRFDERVLLEGEGATWRGGETVRSHRGALQRGAEPGRRRRRRWFSGSCKFAERELIV